MAMVIITMHLQTQKQRVSHTYQSEAARDDHRYNESLEVCVFDKLVHVAAVAPERTAHGEVVHGVAARRQAVAARRPTVVRVLHEYHVHLQLYITFYNNIITIIIHFYFRLRIKFPGPYIKAR